MENNSLSNINPLQELLNAPVITKTDIDILANKIVEQILEQSQGLDEIGLMQALSDLTKAIVDKLRPKINLIEKEYSFKGIKYTKSNTGTTLNYEDDEIYKQLSQAVEDRKKELKNAYANKDKEIIKKSDGEIIPIVSVKKHNKEIIKLELKK